MALDPMSVYGYLNPGAAMPPAAAPDPAAPADAPAAEGETEGGAPETETQEWAAASTAMLTALESANAAIEKATAAAEACDYCPPDIEKRLGKLADLIEEAHDEAEELDAAAKEALAEEDDELGAMADKEED